MILATILPEREANLRKLLASINSAPGFADSHNTLIPYHQFQQLHFARFVIIRANTNNDIRAHGGLQPDDWAPQLAFLGDVDGDKDLFLAELTLRAGDGLRLIFSFCQEFSTEKSDLLSWLHKHDRGPTANYINRRGRTVLQVREENVLASALQKKLSEIVNANPAVLKDLRGIHSELQNFVTQETAALRLRLTPKLETPAGWFLKNTLHLLSLPMLMIILSPILLLGSPVFLFYLRRLEKSDPENTERPSSEHLQMLISQEDIDVTNHFNVFGQVKPGLFRRTTIRFLLGVLNYASRHIYHRGYLTRIQTIHFARWVLLDRGKRVYFASNYDGSADSYMDDFINKVAWGLNLVFSNGVGYPRTRFLVKGGAELEGKYKKTLRRNQLPSESWYKAYPGLTAVDLARNTQIRKIVQIENPSRAQLAQWLGLFSIKAQSIP